MKIRNLLIFFLIALFASPISAKEAENKNGKVTIPLGIYNGLIDKVRDPVEKPRPAPAGYAIGHANFSVSVTKKDKDRSASVSVNLDIKTFENEWVVVPILPSGTAIRSVTVGNKPIELIASRKGLVWSVKKIGTYKMNLQYDVDAVRSKRGYSLSLPVPEATATTLNAKIPGIDLDAAIIPSAGSTITESNSNTDINVTVPSTTGILISWRFSGDEKLSISRVNYTGKMSGEDAIDWNGEFDIEMFVNETATVKLLPKNVTLINMKVDGKKTPVIVIDDYFATKIKGKGRHSVTVAFQEEIIRKNGPPRVELDILPVPVTRIDLTLPGKKELTVIPASNVINKIRKNETVSSVYLPMTNHAKLSWSEAVPEEGKTKLRANASIYHTIHAEEGVIYAQAMAVYEVTRGETSHLELELPEKIQINRITAASGVIADWRVIPGKKGKPEILHLFFDRKVKDSVKFTVNYDRSIIGENAKKRIDIPLLKALAVHRQRGMVALLSGKELTLKPVEEHQVTRVGENQLPSFVRQTVEMTIAHTYKYVEDSPRLVAAVATPERKKGKFDARVNTLISLGDVTMKGSATIEVNVKSGKIMDLQLALPKNVNFLRLTAPSLRINTLKSQDDMQIIDVQFTREMEEQFRIEVSYELIMADGVSDITIPTLSVRGAEVEQGRIAVEALTAVEVQPSVTEQLSSVNPAELPQQLILKTANPILLAYKYAHVDPPYKLTLTITRHKEIEVQSAAIDSANYHTLYTSDGLAITTAVFIVRNSRKQFLRVKLPNEAKVWSAFVDGKPEKPALIEEESKTDEKGPNVLIKIINSTRGFPVTLTYQTPVSPFSMFGTVHGVLPRPDMVVTHSLWDVYLPYGPHYGSPQSSMTIAKEGGRIQSNDIKKQMLETTQSRVGGNTIEPLQINIPTSGVHYRFEKVYANQSNRKAEFSIPYISGAGGTVTSLGSIIGIFLFWIGVFAVFKKTPNIPAIGAACSSLVGIVILVISIGYFKASSTPAFIGSMIILIGAAAIYFKKNRNMEEK